MIKKILENITSSSDQFCPEKYCILWLLYYNNINGYDIIYDNFCYI